MKVYGGARQSGKTTRLVEECIKNDGVLIVADHARRNYVLQKYGKSGLKSENVCVVAKNVLVGREWTAYFDDIDYWLFQYLGGPVKAAACWDGTIGEIDETTKRPPDPGIKVGGI